MTDADHDRFGVAVMALGAAYRQEISEPLYEAYWIATEDLELERVMKAVRKAIRKGGHFMPSPSDLREMAGVASVPYHEPWKGHRYQLPEKCDWPALAAMKEPEGKAK